MQPREKECQCHEKFVVLPFHTGKPKRHATTLEVSLMNCAFGLDVLIYHLQESIV